MSAKNLTITLAPTDHTRLNDLVEFFNDKSISSVSRSDVIKFLINESYAIINKEGSAENFIEFYEKLGVELTVDRTERILTKLKEQGK